jgi:hypothetical protein
MLTMRLYKQLPLSAEHPSFRLLEIDLGEDRAGDHEAVRASVDTYDLRNQVDYDALSYCWGRHDTTLHISLNDEEFPVTENLLAALQQLRRDQEKVGASRKLWVDTVCINQSDNAEKSHQVILMRDIYANARSVIVWIGKPDNLSALAFDTLKRFSVDDGSSDGSATYRSIEGSVEERRAAIKLLLDRPYFTRMWVVQEVVVAKKATVHCGTLSIDFERMNISVKRMTGSGFYPFSAATTNLTYVGNWRESYMKMSEREKEENLDLRLFLDSRDRMATDPRDKIYSLRGIARKAIAQGIRVNYDDSVEKVYTDFSKHVLSIRPDFQILSAVILQHRKFSNLALPSYVPDWTLPKVGGGILQRYYRFKPYHLFRAAGSSEPQVKLEQGSDAISIQGLRLDTVSHVIHIKSVISAAEDGSVSITESILRDLAGKTIGSEHYPFNDEPSWISYFRTLTADRSALSPRIDDEYRSQYLTIFHGWTLNDAQGEDHVLAPAAWAEVSKSIGTIIEDKDMFMTAQGYIGLGHEGFRTGDIVCVFSGGEVPFLLRETANEPKRMFQLLSECYVHGIMDGELMNDLTEHPLEEFWIE